eukprot:3066188-Rhodomonas_salina.5
MDLPVTSDNTERSNKLGHFPKQNQGVQGSYNMFYRTSPVLEEVTSCNAVRHVPDFWRNVELNQLFRIQTTILGNCETWFENQA